jgi:tRNA dimethylallyltransferase
MMDTGWREEAKGLRALPRPLSREAGQALGYPELFAHLDGRKDLTQTIERIRARSRQFAKRQMTWFRNMPECRPIQAASGVALEAACRVALTQYLDSGH